MKLMFQLMRDAVDYAGLFPPAGLPLDEVVANYSNYLRSGERSMLGRLIVPALKLSEFEAMAQNFLPIGSENAPWRISALVPPIEQGTESLDTSKFESAVGAIESFNQRNRCDNRVIVDALEVATPSLKVIKATIQRLPERVSSFLEILDLSNPEPMINEISQALDRKGVYAKIRTGGIKADLIPSPGDVARFIAACAKHDVGFKATAGLHHPIRARYHLTYEPNAPQASLFGFLNVFVAAMIAFEHGVKEEVLIEILVNEHVSRFGFDDHKLTWNNLEVSAERVAQWRERAILSFGSCSFVEPTTELQKLPNVSYASVFSE